VAKLDEHTLQNFHPPHVPPEQQAMCKWPTILEALRSLLACLTALNEPMNTEGLDPATRITLLETLTQEAQPMWREQLKAIKLFLRQQPLNTSTVPASFTDQEQQLFTQLESLGENVWSIIRAAQQRGTSQPPAAPVSPSGRKQFGSQVWVRQQHFASTLYPSAPAPAPAQPPTHPLPNPGAI